MSTRKVKEGGLAMWNTREIVVMAAISVVFGFLYLAWVPVWGVVAGVLGPIGLDVVFGFWFSVSIVAAYVIRKPGAAFTSEMIAAITEILAGSPSGARLLLTGAVQGAGAEAIFAATGWRSYRLVTLLASGASAALFSFVYNYFTFGYSRFALGLLGAMFLVRLLSGAILAGLLGKGVAEALARTGVLSSFAIGRAIRKGV